jgi:signal transduction histidine kinase
MAAEHHLAPGSEPVRFVADARLLSILGEQLIGSEKVGILELVKNAYDAGARTCTVTIEGVPTLEPASRALAEYRELAGPVIEVRDDGSGMSRDEIVNGWLRPATSNRGRIKERLKIERARAAERGSLDSYEALVDSLKREYRGRIPLGEKGVGRLATHRLGSQLWLRTKTADDPLEWDLRIDWSAFDAFSSKPVDLSAIELTLRHQVPTAGYGVAGHGTVITCFGGREGYEWTEETLLELARALGSLRSPRAHESFAVAFLTPHVPPAKLDNPVLREAPFELLALVDEYGYADVELVFKPPDHLENAPSAFRHLDHVDLRTKNLDYWQKRAKIDAIKTGDSLTTVLGKESNFVAASAPGKPQCGPFILHALCWVRLPKWLGADYREVTAYLDRLGGLTIYRDGLLAQPPQQVAHSDWLGLATRQIKKSSNLSYYQLIGEIEIEQTETLTLRDRSSREGMLETAAFNDLTELTKAVLRELETQTRLVRDAWKVKDRSRDLSTPSAISASRASAKLFTTLADEYDFVRDPLSLKKISPALRSKKRALVIASALNELPDLLSARDEERNGLVEAAGFGLAVAIGIHEIANVASGIASECRAITRSRSANDVPNRLREVARRADSLLAETRRLTPLRTTRSQPAQAVSLKKAVDSARNAFVTSLQQSKIDVRISGSDFTAEARFGILAQVFANLFDNSIYWLSTTTDAQRKVRVVLTSDDRTVLFADSGPGISEKMQTVLFEPFYSAKAIPSGLGLYICRCYLSQIRATIRLARPKERCELSGAQFLLNFTKTPEGPQ